jgi:A/G-specific adenine glycosylase
MIPDLRQMTLALLAWLSTARRDLPWRRRRDPYAVWVAEIMLQQTQVATVAPYFERWMTRFPDVETLAEAHLDAVLKAWEGLGYYSRAHNLQRAAQQLITEHGGQLPADREALLRLPGIGRYTAGAILSLAFGQVEPVLDGNVRRVLCRLYDIAEDTRKPAGERRLWALARDLVESAPPGRAGDLNEGLMELGALVCTPGVPDCTACPWADLCLAHARGTQTERPSKTAKRPIPHYDVTAGILQDADGRYLIVRRPAQGLLGGLWGFPSSAAGACVQADALAICLADALRETLGIEATVDAALPAIRHAYTHFRITLHPFRGRLVAGEPQTLGYSAVRWVTAAELTGYAFPVTDRKIADGLSGSPQND